MTRFEGSIDITYKAANRYAAERALDRLVARVQEIPAVEAAAVSTAAPLTTVPPVAMCRRCDEPLVSTFAFDKFEFYCLDCGGHFGWLEPGSAEPTPTRVAAMNARQEEFNQHASGLVPDSRREKQPERDYEEHHAAMEWLAGRVKAQRVPTHA